ncbi:MAG: hypothetical protein IJB35_03490 [Oscillospiraceae bacterium]|nr:hypothetical protein [Oscillospiraceae bacterium]
MSKQGAGYLKLIGIAVGLLLGLYSVLWLLPKKSPYTFLEVETCQVGDGETVSGFVVRGEGLLLSGAQEVTALHADGSWVGAGQRLALGYSDEQSVLTSGRAGYYSSVCDGYERVLTPESLKELSLERLDTLFPQELPQEAYGRLIYEQNWYFVAVLPAERLPQCKEGGSVTLCLEAGEFPAEILRVGQTEGEEFLLVLGCDRGLGQIANLRFAEAELIFSRRTGLLIPKSALYYQEGEAGVYVLQGAQAQWKGVQILSKEGDSLLILQQAGAINALQEGDSLVLTQRELYDGKVLK